MTQLVGYSLGRLGPLYFLEAASDLNISKIRSIILIDPGNEANLQGGCDTTSPSLRAPLRLKNWLKRNDSNRLVIIAGTLTQQNNYAGLRRYFSGLSAATLGRQVLVCKAAVNHEAAMKNFVSVIGRSPSCPAPSKRDTTINSAPAGASPGAPAPAPAPEAPSAGAPAPAPAAPAPVGRVSVAQGPVAPYGYRYAIEVSGFPANSAVSIVCRDSVDPGGFYSFTMTTNSSGAASTSNQCYSADGPEHWVTANGIESNRVVWNRPAPAPTTPSAPATAAVTVDNRVTNGGSAMREDTPAYLSTVTRNFCKRDSCALGGTDLESGNVITAECTVLGDRTTNGQDNSTVDDGNPGLFSSNRWYGIRWGDGRFGFISEVWIRRADRGGKGLRGC